jgi:hypothetical protein
MALYYWLNQGRLGNLLFQYAAIIEQISQRDQVYSFHNELFDFLEMDRRFHVMAGPSRLARSVCFRFDKAARFAARHSIVGSLSAEKAAISSRYPVETSKFVRACGALGNYFLIDGFFQDSRFNAMSVPIKRHYLAAADSLLRSLTGAEVTVAVHIRLTDYEKWSVYGVPGASIPASWYRERMADLRSRLSSPTFVVFSDDMIAAQKLDLGSDVVHFSGSVFEDFTAMACCSHVIMSPSTFAWWSAFIFQRPDKILVAPTYWAGFKSGIWYPPTMMTSGVEYYPAL